jgi:type II secretory pathway pseudopilin PulG
MPPGPPGAPPYPMAPLKKTSSAVPIVIVLIVVCFGGIFVLGIVAAIAIPALLRARMGANEAAAISTMRTMASAQATWASTHGGDYAAPQCLGAPASCGDPAPETFLPLEIATLETRSGYNFGFVLRRGALEQVVTPDTGATPDSGATPDMRAPDVDLAADPDGFAYWAVPADPGTTATRSFCVDETGMVLEYGRDARFAPPTDTQPRCPDTGRPLR